MRASIAGAVWSLVTSAVFMFSSQAPFLDALARPDLTLDTSVTLRDALKEAGSDEAMMKDWRRSTS